MTTNLEPSSTVDKINVNGHIESPEERNAYQFPRIKIVFFSLYRPTGEIQHWENIMKHKKRWVNATYLQKRKQSMEYDTDVGTVW